MYFLCDFFFFFFFKQKTAYEMRISDWSSDVCSSDLYMNACSKVTTTRQSRNSPRIWTSRSRPWEESYDDTKKRLDADVPAHGVRICSCTVRYNYTNT